MTGDLAAILDYVDALRALDTTSVEPMTHAVPFDCPLRDDQVRPRCRSTRRWRTPRGGRRASSRCPGSFPVRAARPLPRTSRDRRARRNGGRDRRRRARGQAPRARRGRAVPGSHHSFRWRARLLPAGRRRRGPRRGRRGRRGFQGGERSRAAGRRSARYQGHLLHARPRDHLRLEDPARLRPPLRVDGDGAPGGRRRGRAGQAEHGRVRDGLVEREQLGQAGAKPLVDGARPGRLVGRLGGGGGGVAVRRARPAPTPAARSGSRPRSAGSSA